MPRLKVFDLKPGHLTDAQPEAPEDCKHQVIALSVPVGAIHDGEQPERLLGRNRQNVFDGLFSQIWQGLGRIFPDCAEFVEIGEEAFQGILMLP